MRESDGIYFLVSAFQWCLENARHRRSISGLIRQNLGLINPRMELLTLWYPDPAVSLIKFIYIRQIWIIRPALLVLITNERFWSEEGGVVSVGVSNDISDTTIYTFQRISIVL